MKLFVATVPNSECDHLVQEMCSILEVAYSCDKKLLPEERDANYYAIDFGKSQRMAEANQKWIIKGPFGHTLSDIGRSVYGLYRTDIIDDDTTLDEYIERI